MATIELEQPVVQPSKPEATTPAIERRHFTISEYEAMGAAGVLKDGERTELIGGEVLRMSPMGPRHASIFRRLNIELIRQCSDKGIVSPQLPLQLDNFTEPEPDLVLLRNRADDYGGGHPRGADTLLVIEVSDSTLAFDREVKTPRYATAGIPEVWIVDIEHQQIEQYSQPNQGTYEKKEVRKIDDEIRSLGQPLIVISVKKLFA